MHALIQRAISANGVPSPATNVLKFRNSNLNQRAKYSRLPNALVAVLVVMACVAPRAVAQPGGNGMGSVPTNPATMFGKKKDNREISGPSLSATDEPVADIRIVGNTLIPNASILNELQTRIGRPFDPALVQRDVRKLTSKGWFVDVRPSYEQASNGRIVIFTVVERPIVRYVEYLGNYGIRTRKIQKELDLKVGGPVDPYAVQEAKRKLIDLYRRNGYNNAQVSILEGDKPTDHGIVFVINEGTAQKIWKVEFVGNEFLSERRLRTKIDSKPPLMKIFKGYVDREQIESDINKLTAFYRSYGFFQARIGRQLDFDEKNKWLTLRFVIHEGPRYQVESVAFIGNKIFSNESLTSGVEMKPDPKDRTVIEKLYHTVRPLPPGPQPFEQARMNADVEWLKELYGSQGYIFADIQAEPIFLEETGKLRLMYHINEGKRWRVGNVFVHINGEDPHTKITTALNRLSLRSGEVADIREIRSSERRLQASGLFMTDPVRGIMPKIVYHIPELDEAEIASGKSGPGFRGQSPDRTTQPEGVLPGISFVPTAGLPVVNPPAPVPPLLPPPTSASSNTAMASPATPAATSVYKVGEAPVLPEGDAQFDVHLYLEKNTTLEKNSTPAADFAVPNSVYVRAPAPATGSTGAAETTVPQNGPVRYEAHRPPYDAPPPSAPSPGASTYGRLVVRTQSPYQPPSTQPYASQPGYSNQPGAPGYYQPPANNPYAGLPTTAAPAGGTTGPAAHYASGTYGGQAVGATGPNATAPGSSQYPVRQAAITEPQIPPRGEELPPPPYAPAPQYAPAPAPGSAPPPAGYGLPPVYAPSNVLPPDPTITPVPLPTNPQLLPSTPRDPFTPSYPDPTADFDVVVSEAQTGRIMLGVAVNSDAGLVGQIMLDERNFDWTRYPTSWNDFLDGRAWRGAGQHFRLEAAPGTEVQRYLASFEEPYLWDTPVSLGLSGSYFTRRYRDWDEERLGGRVSLGYIWVENDLRMMLSYRGEDVKIYNPSNPALPELAEVVGNNALHGFKWTIANDTRDSAFLATQGHFLQLELEEVIGSFEYPRIVFDGRQYFLLSERPDHSGRHVLTLSTRVGLTGKDTPIYENFFAGGFSTLRGFEFRGASPVDQNVQVGGEFMWVNTVEYLFPLTADDMIHGVAFCDFGTVEQNITLRGDNFRVAPGVGLRITVPAMGPAPIALDFAVPVAYAETDDKQIFSFNIGLQR